MWKGNLQRNPRKSGTGSHVNGTLNLVHIHRIDVYAKNPEAAEGQTEFITLEGLGKGVHSLIISLCRYVVVIIPGAFIVSRFMGAVGVWHAFWITEVVTAVIAYVVYRKGVKG